MEWLQCLQEVKSVDDVVDLVGRVHLHGNLESQDRPLYRIAHPGRHSASTKNAIFARTKTRQQDSTTCKKARYATHLLKRTPENGRSRIRGVLIRCRLAGEVHHASNVGNRSACVVVYFGPRSILSILSPFCAMRLWGGLSLTICVDRLDSWYVLGLESLMSFWGGVSMFRMRTFD